MSVELSFSTSEPLHLYPLWRVSISSLWAQDPWIPGRRREGTLGSHVLFCPSPPGQGQALQAVTQIVRWSKWTTR